MYFEFLKTQGLAPAVHREIEAFLDSQSNSHPFQFPNWMGAEDGDGQDDKYCAIVRDQGEMRWFAHCGVTFPLGKRRRAVRSLTVFRGPACDDADLTFYGLGKLVETSRDLGFAYLEIAPEWVEHPERSAGSALSRDGWQVLPDRRSTLRLDLAVEEDELLRSFREDTRLNIRRSGRQGIVTRLACGGEDLEGFQRIYFEMAQKKNFLAVERHHLAQVLRWIVSEKHRGALLLACHEETLLGGVLVVRAGKRSWGILSATTKDSRLRSGHVLQWHAIRWAKEHGCADYDLGGYREGIKTGPAEFKRGFCDAVVQFSPAYRYPVKPWLCSMVEFATRARSMWRTR